MYGLDLFSGIGGLTKALEGYVQPVAYCENDRYAMGVLLSRMAAGDLPIAPIWDDVATLSSENVPRPIDIIYGGFPCQDISVAGRGAGLEGKRSGLFFQIARLVGEIRPRFIFLENVPAIARRGGDAVVGTLADLGYDCRWSVLSAADVGAPHLRERWWLLAHAAGNGRREVRTRQSPGSGKVAHSMREQIKRVNERGLLDESARGCEDVSHSQSNQRWRSQRKGLIVLPGEKVENTQCVRRKESRNGGVSQESKGPDSASDASGWPAKSGLCGMADGLPEELDRFGIMGRHVEEKINASHRMGSKGSQESGFEGVLRSLFEEIVARFAPHGWQSEEQFIKEFALALRQLPHPLTLDQREASVATTQALLFGLRQALKTLGAMRNSSDTCYAAWQSLSEAEKGWAFMAARFGIFHEEWPGVPRVASGVKFRVDRLRGLGNSVVPAQAREAFERLIGLK